MEIGVAPDGFSERELLEMALAAASLDVDLAVLFTGPGVEQLKGDSWRGWRQLLDHDLALVYGREADLSECDDWQGIIRLDAAGEQKLRAQRRVLRLRH